MDPRLWWGYLLHGLDALGPRWRTITLVVTACALVLLLERFKRKRSPVAETSPYHERRKEPRYPVESMPVHITNSDLTGELREGAIVNCSISGLGLRADRETAAGTILSVRPIDVPGYTVWALVEVKHCQETDNGWKVGCRFIRTPPWVTPLLKNE